MIDKIEALLREVQTSVGLRLLYPAEHPRIRESVARVLAMIEDIGQTLPQVSAFVVDERVIFEGEPLPGGAPIARGLFTTLKACGFERLTLRRGVTEDELEEFLSRLGDAVRMSGRPAQPPRSSPNIRLASLQAADDDQELAPLNGHFTREVDQLKQLWSGISQDRTLEFDMLHGVVLVLSKTVEENLGALLPMAALRSHDEYTATHITNVGILSMALSEALGLPENAVHDVGIAALLHDVGKLGVPDEILNKPDRLNEAQQVTMRRHPEEGARVLLATTGVPELAVAVAYEHHMRYDGGGYPSVPRGWKRTLATAITQVADIYDALRTDRPYRSARPHGTIEQMMLADSGALFDPELLDVFFDVVATGNPPSNSLATEATGDPSPTA